MHAGCCFWLLTINMLYEHAKYSTVESIQLNYLNICLVLLKY